MGLEMDPRRKSVEEVAGAKFSRSAMPNPADHTGSPSRTTATPIPGTLFADMKLETAFSISERFSAETLFCCAEAAEKPASKKTSRQRTLDPKSFVPAFRALTITGSSPVASLSQTRDSRNMGTEIRHVLRPSPPNRTNALTRWSTPPSPAHINQRLNL